MKKHTPAFGNIRGAGISSLRARDAHEGWVRRPPPPLARRRKGRQLAAPPASLAARAWAGVLVWLAVDVPRHDAHIAAPLLQP